MCDVYLQCAEKIPVDLSGIPVSIFFVAVRLVRQFCFFFYKYTFTYVDMYAKTFKRLHFPSYESQFALTFQLFARAATKQKKETTTKKTPWLPSCSFGNLNEGNTDGSHDYPELQFVERKGMESNADVVAH